MAFRSLVASASRRAVSTFSSSALRTTAVSANAFSRLIPSSCSVSCSSSFGVRSFASAIVSPDFDNLPPLPDPSSFNPYQNQSSVASVTRNAPQFTADAVVNGEFKSLSLSDFIGKYVVLIFYPLDFTFVCPTELISFSDRYSEFSKLNCEVLGISVDSKFTHLAWQQTPKNKGGIGKLNYPLIADITKSISADYNVLLSDKGIALRGTFIIDDKGVIRSSIINDLPVGRSVDEILRLVQAFQYSDVHGDVIPCNWKPGKETMKGDPKGAQEYFKKIKD